jgi:hypothetical protein
MNLIGNWQDSLKGGPPKQGQYLQMTAETHVYKCIHAPCGIRAGDPSLRAVGDRARFRPAASVIGQTTHSISAEVTRWIVWLLNEFLKLYIM